MVVLPQTRSRSFHGVENPFRLDGMKLFVKSFEFIAGPCSPKHGPILFTVLKNRLVWMLCNIPTTFKWTAGRAPQTRSSSSHGVEKIFRQDCMKLLNRIQVNGWAVLSQARPNFVHGLEEIFCLDVMQPFENLQVYGWAALPNIPSHGPAHSAALKNSFVLMLCSLSTTFKGTTGLAFPNTVLLISRCWRIFSSGWYEAFQKLVNFRWAVLPQTRPSFFHGVDELISLDVMQPDKNIQVHGWAALPYIPCHGPAHFAALKNRFVLMLCRLSRTFKWTAARGTLNMVPFISRCWRSLSSGWYEAFLIRFEFIVGPCSPKHGSLLFTVLKSFFVWMLCSHLKTFKLMAGPHSPTSFLTAQLISRPWKIISSWC